MKTIYFDNAASSWPKPPAVVEAMRQCVELYGANPGRGSHHMAVQASRILFETRTNLAKLFNISNPNDIAFANNASMALNLAIKGFLKPGQHVISTSIEHNSVRRPLEYMKSRFGVQVDYVHTTPSGELDLEQLEDMIKPNTTLIICTHGSNLLGSILPIKEIGEMAHRHGARLLVDAAQTAGTLSIDVQAMGIDMLAFPGHKGLLGPQGTGGLYIHPELVLEPLVHGGTGSRSEDIQMPETRPDRYEGGTLNTPGFAGLNEGVKFILNETVESIHNKEWKLSQRLMNGLLRLPKLTVIGPPLGEERTGIVSFYVDGRDSAELAFLLDREFHIAVRAGYHCTPLGHRTAGTLEIGAVRASCSCFTTESEVDTLIEAVSVILNRQ